jgi:hypothetical protein
MMLSSIHEPNRLAQGKGIMFKLTEGQTVTIRQSLEFYPNGNSEIDPDYGMYIVDGPVSVKIIAVCQEPSAEYGDYYNVDVEVTGDSIYAGDTINIDIEPGDIEA